MTQPHRSPLPLTAEQRERVESAYLRLFRSRYPGRAVRIEWKQPNTLSDTQPSRADHDRVNDAA